MSSLLSVLVENNVLPSQQVCTLRDTDADLFRCLRCGPGVYYCAECLKESHAKCNIFHVPEEWKVNDICC